MSSDLFLTYAHVCAHTHRRARTRRHTHINKCNLDEVRPVKDGIAVDKNRERRRRGQVALEWEPARAAGNTGWDISS